MILGVAIRNYKVYKKLQYIPISYGSYFSAFIGANGIGKTSIFEVLDKFFNGGDWISHNEANKQAESNSFVAPFFLIPVDKLDLTKSEKKLAKILSEYFWSYSNFPTDSFIQHIKDAKENLSSLGIKSETHYLMLLGIKYHIDEVHFPHFESEINEKIAKEWPDFDSSEFNNLLKKVKNYYKYIYLPVEANSAEFTKMESMYVQKLLDETVSETIQKSISRESIDGINKKLDDYVTEINLSLDNYVYKPKWKYRLTVNDLISQIIGAYFGARDLHKKTDGLNTSIRNLSSGEKRKALIDLSYSLISKTAEKKYQIILAIDEPDASMHVAACHDQFEKIAKIPSLCKPNPQVLINTHWYGFLPIVRSGTVHSLTRSVDSINFFSFNLENFREHIKQKKTNTLESYPMEVELKSYQDMIQSVVVSMLRNEPYNWIFCEGHSDKIYLNHYLDDLVVSKNLRIVPLGGFKEVRRVYSYLSAPLLDKDAGFKGSALCLVDTDAKMERVTISNEVKKLFFMRLVRDEVTQKVDVVPCDSQLIFPTEIEFSLREEVFNKLIDNVELHSTMINFSVAIEIHKNAKTTPNSNNLFDYLNIGPKEKKQIMDNFFDIGNNKVSFAKAYVSSDPEKLYEPDWIKSIRNKFIKK